MIQLNHLLIFIGLFFTHLISAQTIVLPSIGDNNMYNSDQNVAGSTTIQQRHPQRPANKGNEPVFMYLTLGGGRQHAGGLHWSSNLNFNVLFGKNYSIALYTDNYFKRSKKAGRDCLICTSEVTPTREAIRTIGFMGGKIIPTKIHGIRFNMKSGLGISTYARPGKLVPVTSDVSEYKYEYDIKKSRVVSLTFQPMLEFTLTRFVGLGVGATVHINKYTTFFGMHANLQVGYLRTRLKK